MEKTSLLRLDAQGSIIGLNVICGQIRSDLMRFNDQVEKARENATALVQTLEVEWATKDNAGETGPHMATLESEIALLHKFLEDERNKPIPIPEYTNLTPNVPIIMGGMGLTSPYHPGDPNAPAY